MSLDSGREVTAEPLLLAIDCGTQSIRALLFDLQGKLLEKSKVELEPYTSPQPGWAEQDVDYYWRSLCYACHQLWSRIGDDKQRIAGLALTCQRATLVNLDEAGKPLRPAINWLDQRRAENLPPIGGGWDALFRVLGQRSLIDHFRAQAESNWLRIEQPDLWQRSDKFLFLSGYLNYRLCGRFVDSAAAQVGYIPFSYRHQRWSPRWNWKWPATGIHPGQLPELVPAATPLGVVSEAAASATGLPAGLPLIAAAADKACEVIGSGCRRPDQGALSYGTTATINTTSKKYIEPVPLLPAYPSAIPGSYCTEVQIFRGFWMVNWFVEQFGRREAELAGDRSCSVEQVFDELIADIPPGSDGLVLQPYWSPGVRHPGPEARGAIIGFSDVHGRAHMYRAMLEGLAFALLEGARRIEKRSGIALKTLHVSGGGSQSDPMMQITADVFGLPAHRPHTYETSGLGAAMDVAVGLGLYADFDRAIEAMSHDGDVFHPRPDAHQRYRQLYEQVYQKLYPRLSPLYRTLRTIFPL